jgi:hypothetical protein
MENQSENQEKEQKNDNQNETSNQNNEQKSFLGAASFTKEGAVGSNPTPAPSIRTIVLIN